MRSYYGVLWFQSIISTFNAQQRPLARALSEGTMKSAQEPTIATNAFENYVEEQMKTWQVPGVAIAVLEGNETWIKVSLTSHLRHMP